MEHSKADDHCPISQGNAHSLASTLKPETYTFFQVMGLSWRGGGSPWRFPFLLHCEAATASAPSKKPKLGKTVRLVQKERSCMFIFFGHNVQRLKRWTRRFRNRHVHVHPPSMQGHFPCSRSDLRRTFSFFFFFLRAFAQLLNILFFSVLPSLRSSHQIIATRVFTSANAKGKKRCVVRCQLFVRSVKRHLIRLAGWMSLGQIATTPSSVISFNSVPR